MASSSASRAVPIHLAEHADDENGFQRGYIQATDYSLPYFSQWSRMHEPELTQGIFRHINCGYLSTHGLPPTLLALKQHAQSLCALIHELNPTLRSAEILTGEPTSAGLSPYVTTPGGGVFESTEDPLAIKYERNDAFDFLSDLTVPYSNDDPNHNKPLTGLLNEVRRRHEAYGTDYHCPLAETKPRGKGEPQKPYANHHLLVMHANACLERLDHEFSATGGILSLLPTTEEHDETDLKNARNSLLGQWIFFTQRLVGRMHELERAYGNALDALAGEASIPHQHMSALGPEGRSGRSLVFPQDRWVLVNAGDDIFEYIHGILDKQEAMKDVKEKVWKKHGELGKFLWNRDHSGKDYARGIIPVTLPTRFYRLAGQGHNTLFVLPAWGNHPGVTYTKEIEDKPTVVACVQPKFPPRVTELEKRYNERIQRADQIERDNMAMRNDALQSHAQMSTLAAQNQQLAETRDALLLAVGQDKETLAVSASRERERAERAEDEVKALELARRKAEQDAGDRREQVEALLKEMEMLRVKLAEEGSVQGRLRAELMGLGQNVV